MKSDSKQYYCGVEVMVTQELHKLSTAGSTPVPATRYAM